MSNIKVGPAKYKQVGLATGAIIWVSATVINYYTHENFLFALQLIGVLIFPAFGVTCAYRQPIEVEFKVGSQEIHTVKFVYKQTLSETLIFVDGRQLVKSDKPWHSPHKEEFKLLVGSSELHKALIRRKKSLFAAFSGGILFDIEVDGVSLNSDQVSIRHISSRKQKSLAP